MLTNVHNWVLKEFLKRKDINDYELDIFLYNIAPDSLPMHRDISPEFTHKIRLKKELLSKYPKLEFVKYHLMVDNLGHYGSVEYKKTKSNFEKEGYAYLKGREIIEDVKKFYNEAQGKIDNEDALYLAHTIVEIALDLRLSRESKEISNLFFEVQTSQGKENMGEYYDSLSELYGLTPDVIREARKAPIEFYGEFKSMEDFFLNKRARLILRKTKRGFTNENIESAKRIVLNAMKFLDDYPDFLNDCVEKIIKKDVEILDVEAINAEE